MLKKVFFSSEKYFIWLAEWISSCRVSPQLEFYNIDNPGWSIEICLDNLDLKCSELEYRHIELSKDSWFGIGVNNNKFNAAGDPMKLPYLLAAFKLFIEQGYTSLDNLEVKFDKRDVLVRLADWYKEECDGDWEHQYGINLQFSSSTNLMWKIKVDLDYTLLEDLNFEGNYHLNNIEYIYSFSMSKFNGIATLNSLYFLLGKFVDFIEEE